MIRRFLVSLILSCVLVLPAFPTIVPEKNSVPETDKSSLSPKQQEQVIVITTAKDPKVEVTIVEKNGKIVVPQSKGGTTSSTPAIFRPSPAATSEDNTASASAYNRKDSDNLRYAVGPLGSSTTAAGGSGLGLTVAGNMQAAGSFGAGSNNPGLPNGSIPYDSPWASIPWGYPWDYPWPVPPPPIPPPPYVPPTLPTAQLQELLNQSLSGTGVPGAIMAVRTRWGTWTGAAGTADLASNQPMTTDMQVSLAAGTKLFTAALIMKLREQNKLDLTDTVDKWLPGQVIPGGDNAAAQKITIGMLLNHTSGLHDYETTTQFEHQLFLMPTITWSNADVLYIINTYPLDFTPGTAYKYSNSNYYLLGMIAEAATGDIVQNLIKTNFFNPLGMSRSALSRSGQKTPPYPRSYCRFSIPLYPDLTDTTNWDLSWDWTSGSGVTTAQDMLTWLQALFTNRWLLRRQSLTQMVIPQAPATSYGYGLSVMNSDSWYGERLYYHTGENPGSLTCWLYYPTSGRIIFIALNRDDKRFLATDPAPQTNANQVVTYLLNGVSTLLIKTGSQ